MKKIKLTKNVLAYIELLFVVLIWSFTPIVFNLKIVKESYSPGMIILLRVLFATLALGIINVKKLKSIHKEYFKTAIPSGFVLGVASISQMVGYRYGADPGTSAVLENLALIVIPILMYVCVKQKPTWTKIIAAVLCFFGSAMIALAGSEGNLFAVSLGKWLACIAGIFYGVNFVVTGVYAKKLDSSLFVFMQLAVQSVLALAYVLIGEKILLAKENVFAFSLDIGAFTIVAAFGILTMGICWVLRAHCLKSIPVMVVSIIMPFATVLTGVWSVIGGMETFTWDFLIGGLIVIAAIFIAELKTDATEKNAEGQEEDTDNGRD